MFLLNSVDFQQLKQLMFLAEYWVYKLKQVDISRVSIADRNRALGYLEAGWTVPRVASMLVYINRPTQLQIGHGAEDRG